MSGDPAVVEEPSAPEGPAEAAPRRPSWRRRLLRGVLLLVGVGVFAGLVHLAGPAELLAQLRRFGWGFALVLLPGAAGYLIEAGAWRFAFATPPDVSLLRLFAVRSAGEALNNTLPAAYLGGEPVKALLLQRSGVPGMEALASAIVAKTAQSVAQVGFVVLGLTAACVSRAGSDNLPVLVGASLAALAFGSGAIYMAYLGQRQGLGRLLERVILKTGWGTAFLERRRDALVRLDAALTGFYRTAGSRFWVCTALFFAGWVVESFEVLVFARLLDLPLSGLDCFAIAALATVVKAAGFFMPASLGAQEGGNVLLFFVFGLGKVTGLTYSVVRRIRELVWVGVGLACLAWLGGMPREEAAAELGR